MWLEVCCAAGRGFVTGAVFRVSWWLVLTLCVLPGLVAVLVGCSLCRLYHVCRRHNPVISISILFAAANVKNLWNWGTLFRYKIVAKSMILRVGYRPMTQSVPNFLLMVVSYSLWLCKIKYLVVVHLLSGKIRNSGWVCMFFKDL